MIKSKFPGWGVSVALALGVVFTASASGAHPINNTVAQPTVIANFPVNGPSYGPAHRMIIANYPINSYGAYPAGMPGGQGYAPVVSYSAPPVLPVAPVAPPVLTYSSVPAPVPYVEQASFKAVPAPVPKVVAPPVIHHMAVPLPVHQDCICARSASGGKVNVFRTAGRWQSSPMAKIGGGKKTIDVRGFHQGYWRVSFRQADGGVKYGWVRAADLVCKK